MKNTFKIKSLDLHSISHLRYNLKKSLFSVLYSRTLKISALVIFFIVTLGLIYMIDNNYIKLSTVNLIWKDIVIPLASNPWFTLILGVTGAQIINHTIISNREKKKLWREEKYKFYWPLYVEITELFETSRAYRPDLLKKNFNRYEQEKKIFEMIGKNIEYANPEILTTYYELRRVQLYEDTSDETYRKEHELFFKILKYFYIYSRKNKELKKDGGFFKSRIILFRMWQLSYKAQLDDPDGAAGLDYLFNKDKLATLYSINKLERAMKYPIEKQKKFLKRVLNSTVERMFLKQVCDGYFSPSKPWENNKEVSLIQLREAILNGEYGGELTIEHREFIREELLSKVYKDTFEGKIDEHTFQKEEYNQLYLEKRLAYEYLKDMKYLESSEDRSLVIMRITASGTEKVEREYKKMKEY